jgi:hypothetical protein
MRSSLPAFDVWSKGLLVVWFISGQLALVRYWDQRFVDSEVWSGVLLFSLVVFLVALQWRKSLSGFRWGRVATWTQVHIWMGWITGFQFLCHTRFSWPQGGLDVLLYALFVLTFFSGVVGWWLTRTVPRRLADVSQPVLAAELPFRVRACEREARERVRRAVLEHGSDTLMGHYRQTMEVFFAKPAFFWLNHRRPSAQLTRICRQNGEIRRYLSKEEQEILVALEELAQQKDDLDYLFSGNLWLRLWLMAHLPLAYGTLFLGLFHGLWMLAFHGGRFD